MVLGIYIYKKLTNLHDGITKQLHECLGMVSDWFTVGQTVLIIKDKKKGWVARNYQPIDCLPWKLITGIFTEKIGTCWTRSYYLMMNRNDARKNQEE